MSELSNGMSGDVGRSGNDGMHGLALLQREGGRIGRTFRASFGLLLRVLHAPTVANLRQIYSWRTKNLVDTSTCKIISSRLLYRAQNLDTSINQVAFNQRYESLGVVSHVVLRASTGKHMISQDCSIGPRPIYQVETITTRTVDWRWGAGDRSVVQILCRPIVGFLAYSTRVVTTTDYVLRVVCVYDSRRRDAMVQA